MEDQIIYWLVMYIVAGRRPCAVQFLDRPGRRETRREEAFTNGKPEFIDRCADDGSTNEPKEKYAEPSASNHVASSGAVDRTNERTEKCGEPSASNHVVSEDTEYSTDCSRDL
jgi:hypothetical protein